MEGDASPRPYKRNVSESSDGPEVEDGGPETLRLNEAVATGTVEADTTDGDEPEADADAKAEALRRALHEEDTDDGEGRGRDEAALDTLDDIAGKCSS